MPEREIRLGVLSFLNAYPVYAGLARLAAPGDPFRFVARPAVASPVVLNAGLAAGDLELAPGSSVALGGRPERFLPAPGISISSRDRVGSVVLISKVPLRDLSGGAVALPANSATSVALLRVLCREHWRIRPLFVPHAGPPRLRDMLATCQAALLIGDEALRARLEAGGLVQVDLGQAWRDFCGLPPVFALWAFRAEWAAARPEAFRWACGRLRAAQAAGMELLPQAIPRLAAERGLPEALVREYFELLDYGFEEPHRQSLRLLLTLTGEAAEEASGAAPAGAVDRAAKGVAAGGR